MNDLVENHFKNDRYQVFLLTSPATMPFSFASHPWFVINRKGVISRFGVGWRGSGNDYRNFWKAHTHEQCRGHLHKNAKAWSEGLEIFYALPMRWNGKIIGTLEGGEDSAAARMAEYIEHSTETYPYAERYSLLGPNSNTYAAWILKHFPESGLQLPWNAFGKNFV